MVSTSSQVQWVIPGHPTVIPGTMHGATHQVHDTAIGATWGAVPSYIMGIEWDILWYITIIYDMGYEIHYILLYGSDGIIINIPFLMRRDSNKPKKIWNKIYNKYKWTTKESHETILGVIPPMRCRYRSHPWPTSCGLIVACSRTSHVAAIPYVWCCNPDNKNLKKTYRVPAVDG